LNQGPDELHQHQEAAEQCSLNYWKLHPYFRQPQEVIGRPTKSERLSGVSQQQLCHLQRYFVATTKNQSDIASFTNSSDQTQRAGRGPTAQEV
jgi:hypothetical protein